MVEEETPTEKPTETPTDPMDEIVAKMTASITEAVMTKIDEKLATVKQTPTKVVADVTSGFDREQAILNAKREFARYFGYE